MEYLGTTKGTIYYLSGNFLVRTGLKIIIQVVCKEVVVSSSRQFYGITLSSTEVRWVTKMGREGRFSKNFKVSGNMDGMAAAVDQQQMIFRRRHHSRNNSNFIFETQKLNFWPAYFDKNIYLVPRYYRYQGGRRRIWWSFYRS